MKQPSFPTRFILVALLVLPGCADASAQLTQSEQPNPELAAAVRHNNTGLAHMKRRDYVAAKQEFQKAIALNPKGAGYVNLGTLLLLEGDSDGAMANYRSAIAANPNNELAYYNLANVLKQMGRTDSAAVNYREAIRVKPDYAAAHYNLGNILRDQGDASGAVTEFRRTIEIDRSDYQAHYNLALLLKSRGARAEAIEHFREFLQFVPNVPENSTVIGYAREHLRNLEANK